MDVIKDQDPKITECNQKNDSELTQQTNDWSIFSEWVHCMCVVTFDLELGQAVEVIYPEKFTPSEQEKTNICYLAFPDSNSSCMGDTQFHVRLRLAVDGRHNEGSNKLTTATNSLILAHKRFNSQCNAVQKADQAHFWGFVYFRQKKETSLPRGYFQKSFILLTRLPFFNLFYEIISQVAPLYFQHGLSVIESSCYQISKWPPLQTGELLKLPLFDIVYQTTIPQANSKSGSAKNVDNANCNVDHQKQLSFDILPSLQKTTKLISSVSEIDVFRSLSCVISNIYTLWELVLTGEPIVVIGSSPADTSHMVQSLISLIAPLEYCAESRPYFTIHDSEFKEFTREQAHNNTTPPPGIIIGVTNPFFVKLLKDWPHMIRVPMRDSHGLSSFVTTIPTPNTACVSTSSAAQGSLISGMVTIPNNKRLTPSPTDNNTSGLFTKYKPFLKKDKAQIKKILLGVNTKRPEHVQSVLLRRNFLELTQSFMIPLERYMASLMPLKRDISPFKSAPNPNQFKQDDFLATLDHSGPHLTSPLKGNWKGLYQRFFNSANFKGWFETRYKELQKTLQSIQLQALSGADLNQWAQGKQEVEIIDMIIKLKQKLNLSSSSPSDDSYSDLALSNYSACSNDEVIEVETTQQQTNETRRKLLFQIESMKQTLPDDLKTILFDS